MRYFLIIYHSFLLGLLLLHSGSFRNELIKSTDVLLCEDSYLKINGTSNVNSFECRFDMGYLQNPLSISYNEHDETIAFKNTVLILPNRQFDCGGKLINKDFNKLLNTDTFPEIYIELKQAEKGQDSESTITAEIDVMISNIINTYKTPVQISSGQNLTLKGEMPLDISDFNLEPPRKMFGIIKVSPRIEIEFFFNIQLAE